MSSSELPPEVVEAFRAEFGRLLGEILRETFANLTPAMVENEAAFIDGLVAAETKVLGDNPEHVVRNPEWTSRGTGSPSNR